MTWNFRAFLLGLALPAMTFGFLTAHAGTAALSWTIATTYTDGAPMPPADVQAHRIEWSQCAAGDSFGQPAGELVVAMPDTSAVVSDLPSGRWCFRAYTVAVSGLESDASSVVAKTITSGKPGSPTIVQIDIQATAVLEQSADGSLKLTVR